MLSSVLLRAIRYNATKWNELVGRRTVFGALFGSN